MQPITRNSLRVSRWGSPQWFPRILMSLIALFALCATADAQLSGTYTIGSGGSYATIESAISALSSQGVSGPVTFLINGGTYTAPTTGYVLPQVATMNATNTVTFRPNTEATVEMTGSGTTAILDFNGGDYYIIDGSNTVGGTSRDWKVTSTSTSGHAVRFINGAQHNTVRNMNLMANATGTATTGGVIQFYTSNVVGGNSFNHIVSNTIGDSAGIERSAVAIVMYGSSGTYMSEQNVIEDNYIINYGIGTGTGYGLYYSSYNKLLKFLGNWITHTQTDGVTGARYGLYITNSYSAFDTIAYNRIWGMSTSTSNAQYAIYLSSQGPDPIVIHHNFIALTADLGTFYGIRTSTGDPLVVENNTILFSGNSTSSATSYMLYNSSSLAVITYYNNILVMARSSSSSNSNRIYYNSASAADISSDNNIIHVSGNGAIVAYQAGSYYSDLASFQTATGREENSIFATVSFVDAQNGDLHIDPETVFPGEGIGRLLGYTEDIDGDPVDPASPDIGADEGDFIGAGLDLLDPDGGEKFAIDSDIDVSFTANRAMQVRIEFSIDGGTNWTTSTTQMAVKGLNTVTITTPEQVTKKALVRVVNAKNDREGDESGGVFELVMPVLHILAPNGGEDLTPGDTISVRWTSEFTSPTMRVRLEFSPDSGETWQLIEANLPTEDLPVTNSRPWIVPDIETTRGLVRVRNTSGVIGDRSDEVFTILPSPSVKLLAPNGGEIFYAGDEITVRWETVSVPYLKVEYSIDNGGTWQNMAPFGISLPAFLGEYRWKAPQVESNQVLVRLTSEERPRFNDRSDAPFSILRPTLHLLSPNGGEQYELNEPVTVRWTTEETGSLRLEYSVDNGTSWQQMRGGIDAASGEVEFTPPPMATRSAKVRLTNEDRAQMTDVSDGVFEILGSKSIVVYGPSTGERLVRGTLATISWDAYRVGNVRIQYSGDGGTTWQTVVGSVPGWQGAYEWVVSVAPTHRGKIRVSEVGGDVKGESGLFSVEEATAAVVRVEYPNGGEVFHEGDEVRVKWTAAGVTTVRLSYSSDGGGTWHVIQGGIPGTQQEYEWRIGSEAGTEYKVKVEEIGGVWDVSDEYFTVEPKVLPRLVLLYPNGGQRLKVDTTVEVRWDAQNVNGDIELSYAVKGASDWTVIGTAPAADKRYEWTIPDEPGQVKLRIRTVDGSVSDESDDWWEIYVGPAEVLVVTRPNGGETWRMGTMERIEWKGPASVTAVDVYYSTNGGGDWTLIEGNVASMGGDVTNVYEWNIPTLVSGVTNALVRVVNSSDSGEWDESNAVFSIEQVAGVTGAERALRVEGVYPNPLRERTELRWKQEKGGMVVLSLYDGGGRRVVERALGKREAGAQRYELEVGDLESGTYVYELRMGADGVRGRLVVVR